MATTITPLTDQIPTVSDWAGMAAAINAGTEDDLASGFLTDEHYTDRLLFDHEDALSASITGWTDNSRLTVPLGHAYIVDVVFGTFDGLTSSPGDPVEIRLTTDAGVRARGYHLASESGTTTSEMVAIDIAGASSTPITIASQSPAELNIHKMSFVVVGDTASGDVTLQQQKGANTYSNTFSVIYAKMIAKRIW